MNQAMGGIQNRETIWSDIKRAVPFIKVNANRNEEGGLQKQAFLNILQTCCSTQQLQPSFFLKQKPGLQTQVTPAQHTCSAERDKCARAGTETVWAIFNRADPASLTTAAGVISGLLHVSFALSEPLRGGQPTANASRYVSGKKTDSKREVFSH